MSTSLKQITKQLDSQSDEAKLNAIKHIKRGGTGKKIPPLLAKKIYCLYEKYDPTPEDLVEVLVRYPSKNFIRAFMHFLKDGNIYERIRAIENIPVWIDSGIVCINEIEPLLLENSKSENPWIKFLTWLQWARYSTKNFDGWYNAAKTIDDADKMEAHRNIRAQVCEILYLDEIKRINKELRLLNSPLLPQKNMQRPQ